MDDRHKEMIPSAGDLIPELETPEMRIVQHDDVMLDSDSLVLRVCIEDGHKPVGDAAAVAEERRWCVAG